MKIPHLILTLSSLMLPPAILAAGNQEGTASTNAASTSPAAREEILPRSTLQPAFPAASPPPSSSPTPTPVTMTPRELPEIHGSILLPQEWTLLPGKLLQGDVLLATREKITSESDPWSAGLSMTIDRNGAKDSGQKASVYALGLAREAHNKAGDEATPLRESQSGPFHEIRFDFPIVGEPPLLVSEVMRANDTTGTLAVILWQSPREESVALRDLREKILAGIKLDPAQ